MSGAKEPLLPKASEPFKVEPVPPLRILLNPLAWILWILDFLIWLISIYGPVMWIVYMCKGAQTVKVGDAYRYAGSRQQLVNVIEPGLDTVYAIMMKTFKDFAGREACGTRKFEGDHKPNPNSKIVLKKFSETSWMTFAELGEKTQAFGAGLVKLGMKPAPKGVDLQSTTGPHTMVLFEDTSMPWTVACIGAFCQSIAVATSYSTLGVSSVAEAVNETNAATIVCNISQVKTLAEYCSKRCPTLKNIVYTLHNSLESEVKVASSLCIKSMDEVIKMGKDNPIPDTPPDPDQMAVIMYTSGSTGKPKGVMIKHSCMVASINAFKIEVPSFGVDPAKSTYIAYLPAAHIMELIVEMSVLALGCRVGYADPRTISSKGACRLMPDGNLNTKPVYPYPPGAIQEFRPTFMVAVPKIWDILKKGVEETVGGGSSIVQWLFQVAYTGGYFAVKQGRFAPLFKVLVFKKVINMLGGNLKCGVSGGGPISADVQGFIRTVFGFPLIQGYALTESTCAGTVMAVHDKRYGVVGHPVPSVEIILRSCLDSKGEPEVLDRTGKPYLSTDTMHKGEKCHGRGEVMIRGPSLSKGYFKQPDKTAEVFQEDGWFRTGDVGLFTTDNCLQIVDRVKNLVKLKGGEYIALEAMEKEYGTSVYVNGINGGLMCYGDGDMDRPIALVQANTKELEIWAKGQSISYNSVEDLCKLPAVEKLVLDDLVRIGKASSLGSNEILAAIALIPGVGDPTSALGNTSMWSPENGGLTASNKLNRKPIMQTFQGIEKLKSKANR